MCSAAAAASFGDLQMLSAQETGTAIIELASIDRRIEVD